LTQANVFEQFQGDIAVASVAAGPVAIARGAQNGRPPVAVIGFDPLTGPMRYQVSTPLLVAHLVQWLAPEARRETELLAARLGSVTVGLSETENPASLRVTDERGSNVPFTLHGRSLNLFASKPTIVRVSSSERERLLSLTLPEVGEYDWQPASSVRGLPPAHAIGPASTDLWKYLAVVAALLLTLEWWLFGRRRRTARKYVPLGLKICGLLAILLALFQPHLTVPGRRTAALLLVDTSSSISEQDLQKASETASRISKARGGNWLRIVPFSSHARPLEKAELGKSIHFLRASDSSDRATNFEAAISDSLSAVPTGHIPKLVLMSDGNDNEGSAARAIASLQQMHIAVDTIPLNGRTAGGMRLISAAAPSTAYAGEQVPVDLRIDSGGATEATVRLSAEGKPLGESVVTLKAGINDVHLHARVNSEGVTSISGRVRATDGNEVEFNHALALLRAKVALYSGDTPAMEENLSRALTEAGFDITRWGNLKSLSSNSTQLLVLNNVDLNAIPPTEKHQIANFVRDGGGLLLIGGEHQQYKEDKKLDALDEALPAKIAPPKTPEGTCVALIIDKSSSMEGRKIELARLSAIGVVDHLRLIDSIGVLIFDNSFQWAVPMRKAEDKTLIKRLISGIVPDGGTQIAPALTEAYRKVMLSPATYKHIVLMTDGISEEGDSLELARRASENQVTISTVGLGQDVNRTYLEKVADESGGRSYFLNEPQGLEQILLKDVQDYSGSTTIEKALTPIVNTKVEVLEGVAIESAPALRGYARFIAKPDAETILSIDKQKKDPLYVRWQFGLGRAAVFTSDAKSRWAQDWVNWPGFDKFWINISRDLLPRAKATDAETILDSANQDLVVSYRLAPGAETPQTAPEIFVIGPQGFEKPIPMRHAGERAFQGRIHIGEMTGLFRVRPLKASAVFPETGFYRQDQEANDYGTNETLLKQIAALTGGRFNPRPEEVFDAEERTIYSVWQFWPFLLGLAIALTIAELVARKWSGLLMSSRKTGLVLSARSKV
jgi:uncharacterized membrane protein